MKKLFTLITLFVALTMGAQAQERKTWDFTKGFSATTIANLQADTENWTDSEGSGRNWAESKARTANTEITCKVNGETWVVPETKGLKFSAKSAKHLNVVWNGGSNDDSHVWLNGAKDEDAVTIPGVPAGERLTVIFSSHGGNAERGFKVSTAGVADENGNTTFGSSGQQTVVLYNNNTETVDVKLTANVGGMHFYFFQIGDGDQPVITKLAYLYDGNEDAVLSALKANELNDITAINVTAETVTAEALRDYDVTVVSPSVPADNAIAGVLKEVLPWTPVLNLNAALYDVWGYGQAVPVAPFAVVKDVKNSLFANVQEFVQEGDITAVPFASDAIMGISLGEYFEGDAIPAVAMDDESVATIHLHNITHNGYIYLPQSSGYTEDVLGIVAQAIELLSQSKSEITAAAAPAISKEYKDLNTNVTLTAPKLPKAQVFYTLDGTDPTTASTLYEGVINLTQETTVKAVAIAEGYTLSSVAEMFIDIKSQPKTPVIAADMQDGMTIVTISSEEAAQDSTISIWYNFEDTIDTLKSTRYTEPFTITMPQNVTAFAVAGQIVWSEPARQRVLVQNPRVVIDVAAHFEAKQWTADNNPDGLAVANGKGMFSWGASAASMWQPGTGHDEEDSETGEIITVHDPADMVEPELVNEPGENPEWVFKSYGTCLIWQSNTPSNANFGENEGGYNPMYSTDVDPLFPVTKYDIQFYKFYAGEPANASIETINKYQAPLDVVVLANMAGGPLLVQTSADGEQWQTIGEIAATGYSRMWSKYTMSYDGTDEVYVRVTEEAASTGPKVFDIYIANQGEKSLQLLDELNAELAGIQTVNAVATQVPAGIYTLGGTRIGQPQRGLNIIVSADGTVRKVMIK